MSSTVGLSITVFGLAIVISFVVAGLIRLIVVVLPKISRAREAAPASEAQSAAPADTTVPAAHVAAITGAVACIVGPRHIIHIEDSGRGGVWTAEGRLLHQTSHNVPHGKGK